MTAGNKAFASLHYTEAEEEFRATLAQTETFPANDPRTAETFSRLAEVYTADRKFDAALPLLKRRLEIVEKNNQPDSSAARKRKNLTMDLDYVLVTPQLPLIVMTGGLVILPIGIPIHRPDAEAVFRSCRELAKGDVNADKPVDAEATYKQLIDTESKTSPANKWLSGFNIELFDDLIDLSIVYRNDHRYDDALTTIQQSETVGRQIANSRMEQRNFKLFGPPIYPWLSEIERAEIYREMGDTTAAATAFEKSLEMAKDLKNSSGHYKFAEMLDNYATLLRDEGKYDQSEALYKRSLDIWSRSKNPQAPEIAGTLTNYAALLRKVDRPTEAEALETRASAIPPKVPTIRPEN